MRNFRRVHVLMREGDSGRVLARSLNGLALHDEPAGGKGGKADDEPGSGTGRGSGRGPTEEGRAVARKLIQRMRGRSEDAVAQLADENRELRDERRELREQVPKAGTRVLSAEDAKAFDEYKVLGTPADVAVKVKEHGTLATRVAETDLAAAADKAATLTGYNPAALRELVKDKGLQVSFVPAKDAAGKDTEVPMVKSAADKDAKPVSLTDFAKASPLFLPALTAKPAGQGAAGSANGAVTGTQFVEQGSASGSTGSGAESQTGRPSVTKKYDGNAPWQRGKAADATATK